MKCDKAQPICGHCVATKTSCVFNSGQIVFVNHFDEVKKPRTKNYGGIIMQPPNKKKKQDVPMIDVRREDELARLDTTSRHNDFAYEKLCSLLPLISPKKTKEVLTYVRDVLCVGGDEETINIRKDELSLVFLLQAHSFIKLNKQILGRQLFERGKVLLEPLYDEVGYNYTVAACYSQIAYFLACTGELKRCNFFLRNCNDYLSNAPKGQFNQFHEFLRITVTGVELMLEDDPNPYQLLRHMVTSHDIFQRILDLASGITQPRPLKAQVTFNLIVIDSCLSDFIELTNKTSALLSAQDVLNKRLSFVMAANASKISYMTELGLLLDSVTLEFANVISDCIATDSFKSTFIMACVSVAEASKVHLAHYTAYQSDAVYEKLKIDLFGFKYLAERFVYVGMKYKTLMERLENTIQIHNRLKMVEHQEQEDRSNDKDWTFCSLDEVVPQELAQRRTSGVKRKYNVTKLHNFFDSV
ncbi:cecr1a [Acrasis kona]|uniref:Cecr1a n=1 Tax=Acrasis kona TaxID=1008807 RepID=A0AAW2ZPR9_9EUKA